MKVAVKTLLPLLLPMMLIVMLLSSACVGLRSRYHEVETGETLKGIALRYDVPVKALQHYNNATLAHGLVQGQKLYIPFEENPNWNSDTQITEENSTPVRGSVGKDLAAVHFSWPLFGYITSPFGLRKNERHEGIDIAAKKGTIIRASRSGHVIYASNQISGYGNMIIVKHADSFSTVYAHLSQFEVKKGQFVTRGQEIGRVGKTGRATNYHLHFEIRNDRIAVNPLLYLQGQYANNTIR